MKKIKVRNRERNSGARKKSLVARQDVVRSGLAVATLALIASLPLSTSLSARKTPSRSEIDTQVDAMLAKMTLQEKIDLIGGVDGYFVRALPDLNLPRLRMADGPLGVRNFGPATAMAGGINLAATWDPQRDGNEPGLIAYFLPSFAANWVMKVGEDAINAWEIATKLGPRIGQLLSGGAKMIFPSHDNARPNEPGYN